MTNSQIRDNAKRIFRGDVMTFIIAAAIYSMISYLFSFLGESLPATLIQSLVAALVSASSAAFYVRAYNKGKPDFRDMYDIFTYRDVQQQFTKLIMVYAIVTVILDLIGVRFSIIPLVNLIVFIVIYLVKILMGLVYYLFVMNPSYEGGTYLKASVKYMGDHFLSYIVFVFAISILPAILMAVVSVFFGTLLGYIVYIPFAAYIGLGIAGYVQTIVPDEWMSGDAKF